jgi:hypothetical protein
MTSPPRTSPTMILSGLWRSAAFSKSRTVTAGTPVCSPRVFKPDEVALANVMFRSVFDKQNPFVMRNGISKAIQKRRLDRNIRIAKPHRYGGAVITETGTNSSVAGLVYIAAHMSRSLED